MPSSAQLAERTSPSTEIVRLGLTRVVEQWRRSQRGGEYVDALRTFLRSLSSASRLQYTRGISLFFEWCDIVHHETPVPSAITRERAFEYSTFLLRDNPEYEQKRIERSRPPIYGAIYRFLRSHPGAHIDEIRKDLLTRAELTKIAARTFSGIVTQMRVLEVEHAAEDGLDRLLGCMTQAHILRRAPTIQQLRSGEVQAGLSEPGQAQIKYRVDPSIFSYSIASRSSDAGARASTASAYLKYLSSFWHWLIVNSGENARAADPLLRYNVWNLPVKQLGKQVDSHQRVKRAETIMTMDLFNKILGTTFLRLADGRTVASTDLLDTRDRALMLFMLYVATRKEEMTSLKRSDVVWSPVEPYVRIVGKGLKERIVRIPQVAYDALIDLTTAIERLAIQQERRSRDRSSTARSLLEPDGPLFPPIVRWGCTSDVVHRNLGDSAISSMLRSRAAKMGMSKADPEYRRIHAHGFRHLAARLAAMAGTPVPVIQAVLGHSDLSTTSIYTESFDPKDHILFGWQPADSGSASRRPVTSETGPQLAPVPPTAEPRRHQASAESPVVIETVGHPVAPEPVPHEPPAPPPVPSEERIVQVGQLAAPAPGSKLAGREDPAAVIAEVYQSHWGEKGARKPLGAGQMAQIYAGNVTGLPWWAGPTGSLKPEMPVLAPVQVAGFEGPYGSVRDGLEALWHRWMDGQDRGPTSASALLGWIRDALETAAVANDEVERRSGRWVAHDWPLSMTSLKTGAERTTLRVHHDGRAVDWFDNNAWEHRISRGRSGAAGERVSRVVDVRANLPYWYRSADPVADLPQEDRDNLIDWLLALTGRPPVDRTARYQGASRRELAEVIGLLCEYDDRVDELKELSRSSGKDRDSIASAKEDVASLAEALKMKVASATRQRVKDFDIAALTRARAAATRQTVEKETSAAPETVMAERVDESQRGRERRRDFYLRVAGDLFGKEASEDEFLRIFALCSRGTPLGEGLYPQLFRFEKGTIVHTPDFAKRFAKDTGAHSECVARRMARELWELRQKHLASLASGGRGERAISRPDELVETLDAMAAYRVPCPELLEKELQARLGTTNRQPVYEEWERWKEQALPKTAEEERALERSEAVAEEMASAQSEHREAIGREFARAKESEYTPNARRLVPGPVLLLFALYTR